VLFHINWKAEIIPLEPDPDNTGVGRGPKCVVFSPTPPMYNIKKTLGNYEKTNNFIYHFVDASY
jgi:hypothetical protein